MLLKYYFSFICSKGDARSG